MIAIAIESLPEMEHFGWAGLNAETTALALFGIESDLPAIRLPVGSHASLLKHHHLEEVLFCFRSDYISRQ
jgi:hypothetical protein